jgi:hypothetical protein
VTSLIRFTTAAAVALLPSIAWAGLGKPEASISSDQAALEGLHEITPAQGYSRHEIRMSSGTTVREFAADGVVFAVAWDGPVRPDLKQLLGDYYEAAVSAAHARHGHGPLVIRTPEVVLESSGHMRAFQGRAFLPGRVPPDVPLSVIR